MIDDGIAVGTDRGNKYKIEKELAAYDEVCSKSSIFYRQQASMHS